MVGVLSNLTASAAHLKLDTSLTCEFRYLKHLFVSVRQLIINTVTAFDIITQISLYSLTTVYDFVFPVSCQQWLIKVILEDLAELLLVEHAIFVHVELLKKHQTILKSIPLSEKFHTKQKLINSELLCSTKIKKCNCILGIISEGHLEFFLKIGHKAQILVFWSCQKLILARKNLLILSQVLFMRFVSDFWDNFKNFSQIFKVVVIFDRSKAHKVEEVFVVIKGHLQAKLFESRTE